MLDAFNKHLKLAWKLIDLPPFHPKNDFEEMFELIHVHRLNKSLSFPFFIADYSTGNFNYLPLNLLIRHENFSFNMIQAYHRLMVMSVNYDFLARELWTRWGLKNEKFYFPFTYNIHEHPQKLSKGKSSI